MRPLLGVRFERHLNGEKLNASLAELLRGEELSHLLSWHARSWLQIRLCLVFPADIRCRDGCFLRRPGASFGRLGVAE